MWARNPNLQEFKILIEVSLLIPVILSGRRTRLWPVSREAHPKPFIVLPDGQSLLQKTLLRAAAFKPEAILTITNGLFFHHPDALRRSGAGPGIRTRYLPCSNPPGATPRPAIAAGALACRAVRR